MGYNVNGVFGDMQWFLVVFLIFFSEGSFYRVGVGVEGVKIFGLLGECLEGF